MVAPIQRIRLVLLPGHKGFITLNNSVNCSKVHNWNSIVYGSPQSSSNSNISVLTTPYFYIKLWKYHWVIADDLAIGQLTHWGLNKWSTFCRSQFSWEKTLLRSPGLVEICDAGGKSKHYYRETRVWNAGLWIEIFVTTETVQHLFPMIARTSLKSLQRVHRNINVFT